MGFKIKFGVLCILVVFFNLSATQYVEHDKEDLMPGYKDGRIDLTYQDAANNEMDNEEIWYSKVTDDSEEGCNSSEKMPGEEEMKAIEIDAALEEEKTKLSGSAKIKAMLESIVEDKPMPRLHAQSLNRLKKLKRYDSCPQKLYKLHYYWEKPYTRICKVIHPWNHPVTYACCLKRSCCQNTLSPFVFTRCLPCGWTRHRFLVLCYNLKAPYNFHWKVVTRWFPQSCDCHNYIWQPIIQQAPNSQVRG